MPVDQGPTPGDDAPHGTSLPLEVLPASRSAGPRAVSIKPENDLKPYSPERQRDYVRLVVACGLLLILGYVVIFATVEASSYPQHWTQTKEMLQIILPALTGVIGTVIGFYFGTTTRDGNPPPDEI